jgi:hypothetical protein
MKYDYAVDSERSEPDLESCLASQLSFLVKEGRLAQGLGKTTESQLWMAEKKQRFVADMTGRLRT